MSGTTITIEGNSNASNLVLGSANGSINSTDSVPAADVISNTNSIPGFAGRRYVACMFTTPGDMSGTTLYYDISETLLIPATEKRFVQYTFSDDGKSYSLSFGNDPSGLDVLTASSTVYGKKNIPIFESRITPGVYLTEFIDTFTDPEIVDGNTVFADALIGYQQTGIKFSTVDSDPYGKLEWVKNAPLLQINASVMPAFRSYYPKQIYDAVLESCKIFPSKVILDPFNYIVQTNSSGVVQKTANGVPIPAIPYLKYMPKLSNGTYSTNENDFVKIGPI